MPKLLLISKYFSPQNAIGAVRPTKLAKYLARERGWEVSVLTGSAGQKLQDTLLREDERYINEIIRVEEGPLTVGLERFFLRRNAKKKAAGAAQNGEGVSTLIPYELHGSARAMAELNFTQEWMRCREFAAKSFERIEPRLGEFDAVFSTYSPISSHLIALRCKRERPGLVWAADFRDPPAHRRPGLYTERAQGGCNSRAVLRAADIVTCTTDGIPVEMGWNSAKTRLLTNGFDPDDFAAVEPAPRSRYTIAYVGGFTYMWRDPSPVLRAVRALIDEGNMDINRVEFVHAGGNADVLRRYAEGFGLGGAVRCLGALDRRGAIALERSAHALLLLSDHSSGGSESVTPGKFLEYMGAGAPILGCISGDLTGGVIKKRIDAGNLGFCYEQGAEPRSFELLKAWLKAQYDGVTAGGGAVFEPDAEYVRGFSYPALAGNLSDMLEEAIELRNTGTRA